MVITVAIRFNPTADALRDPPLKDKMLAGPSIH